MEYNKAWFAFISAEIIRQCIDVCASECLACRNGVFSPLLHHHNELNLREKLEHYLDRVELNLFTLFDRFVVRFGWFTLDRDQLMCHAQAFADFSTPDAIFYGKYITYENDFALYGDCSIDKVEIDVPSVKEKPIKAKRQKKNATSQNDIPGTSAISS